MNFKIVLLLLLCIHKPLFADSFTVITYNILSKDFTGDEYAKHYKHVPDQFLDWKYRRDKITEKLNQIAADIICLQELNEESFDYFSNALSMYAGYFAKKGGTSTNGIGTFCKKNAFSKIEHKNFLCPYTSNCGKFAIHPLLLTTIETSDKQFYTIIHTKIKWSKAISASIWNHLECILNHIGHSTIVVGDFNQTPEHALVIKLLKGGLKDPFENQAFSTCYANQQWSRIDYILTTKDIRAIPFLFREIETPIPNEDEPSDHLPIGCVITK